MASAAHFIENCQLIIIRTEHFWPIAWNFEDIVDRIFDIISENRFDFINVTMSLYGKSAHESAQNCELEKIREMKSLFEKKPFFSLVCFNEHELSFKMYRNFVTHIFLSMHFVLSFPKLKKK